MSYINPEYKSNELFCNKFRLNIDTGDIIDNFEKVIGRIELQNTPISITQYSCYFVINYEGYSNIYKNIKDGLCFSKRAENFIGFCEYFGVIEIVAKQNNVVTYGENITTKIIDNCKHYLFGCNYYEEEENIDDVYITTDNELNEADLYCVYKKIGDIIFACDEGIILICDTNTGKFVNYSYSDYYEKISLCDIVDGAEIIVENGVAEVRIADGFSYYVNEFQIEVLNEGEYVIPRPVSMKSARNI